MNNIQVLPASIANKIAAGEVVERPASVVKEAVENAIDAEADIIKIILKQSGKILIQVIDNGIGMNESDAVLCFERHATSKISKLEDLDQIATLGFRGEAMPSIAAVSQVELISKRNDEKLATRILIENSVIQLTEKTAFHEHGTSLAVKNLFFNVPARKHFLKSDATEFNHIIATLQKFFLCKPQIQFELHHNEQMLYNLPKASLEKRIQDVLGDEFFSGMLQVDHSLGDLSIYGYVAKPDFARFSKGKQFLFVNNRMIQSRYLHHAICQAFSHKIDANQHPAYCLFFSCDSKDVDINIHPSKMEVRFSNERMIYNLFFTAIRSALNQDIVIPELSESAFQNTRAPEPKNQDSRVVSFSDMQFKANPSFGKGSKKTNVFIPEQSRLPLFFSPSDQVIDDRLILSNIDNSKPEKQVDSLSNFHQFFQIHNRYILSEIKSGFVIIDQHVAHERILYERILDQLKGNRKFASQQLLFPQKCDLSFEDFELYKELETYFIAIGFGVRRFGGTSIVIEAIPTDVKIGQETQVMYEILDYYKENLQNKRSAEEQMAAAFSCKNAIKSGEILSQKEMSALIDQLFASNEPYFCPHGRPIIISMSLEELDKKFKRL